jgi:glycosyltransferase involved in cell wall biosynthesis
MALMDLYLMTSAYEGLPVALLEAMALGKPVVSTAVGGIPEALTDGVEGWLAPVGDVAALSRATLALLAAPEEAAQMGALGAKRIETSFHTRQRVAVMEAAYADLLAGHTAPVCA